MVDETVYIQKNKTIYDHQTYLLGAYFDRYETASGAKVDRTWHQEGDLTGDSALKNVRPIPYTPILLHDDKAPRLWGSDKTGKLCNLWFYDESLVLRPEYQATETLFRHTSPLTTLQCSDAYALSFPPIQLLGQLAGNHNNIKSLHEKLSKLYQTMTEEAAVSFTVSKINTTQLAPAYVASPGTALTGEQSDYNDWHASIAHLETIQGFVIPAVHSFGVLFSSDLYVGAEVSLIKVNPFVDGEGNVNNSETVLAKGFVTKPNPYAEGITAEEAEEAKQTLPSVVFSLNPEDVNDGYFLLRTQFWVAEYLKGQEGILMKDVEPVFPDSLKQGRLQLETAQKHPDTNTTQDVYRYELHEYAKFKLMSGFGKLAMVCGDLISLEECLIYQYPMALPSYADFMAKKSKPAALKTTGLSTLGLVSSIQKMAKSEAIGYGMGGGNPFAGSNKEIMQSVAKSIWDNLRLKEELPPPMVAGVSFLFGLQAVTEARKAYTTAVRFNRSASQSAHMARIFRRGFIDLRSTRLIFTDLEGAFGHSFVRGSSRLASTWFSGALRKTLPGIDVAKAGYDIYKLVADAGKINKKLSAVNEDFSGAATDYLKKIVVVKAEQSFADQYDKSIKIIEMGSDKPLAHIIDEEEGVSIHVYFQFNQWELPNEGDRLRSDIRAVCENLAQLLLENKDFRIKIDGHAGRIGSREDNQTVAKHRAKHIKAGILAAVSDATKKPLVEARIFADWHGNTQPLTADSVIVDMSETADSSGLAKDRRVEVRLIIPQYLLDLPPSRTGMIDLEKIRQVKQALDVGLDNNHKSQIEAVFNGLMGVAMFSPVAPIAAALLLAKAGAELLDTGLSFLDSLLTENAYANFKARDKNINQLNQLGKVHIKVLQEYRKVNVKIETTVLSLNEVSTHLENKKTSAELQKRFLLRALALNGLVELLARISLYDPDPAKRKRLLTEYRVQGYIDFYILNDNWQAPLHNYNTMAVNWINRVKGQAYGALSESTYYSPSLIVKQAKVQGNFNTGFPVQTSLYLDNGDDGFVDFANTFDHNSETINSKDIGLSRMLVLKDINDETSWVPYSEWLNPKLSNRISPFTRIKIQVLLTKEASIDAKKFFKAKLSYNCDRILLDLKGPSFEVLFSACKVTDLASCGKGDDELVAYYKKEFGADYADQTLTAVEFEPTYWFGEYEIPGLKPLYSDYSWESFNTWVKDRDYKSARYYFELNGHTLNLNNKVEMAGPFYSRNQYIQALREATRARTCFTFGIDDTNTWGAQCAIDKKVPKSSAPLTLYDGLSNKRVVLNESDLLIESFIKTTSTTKGEGIQPFLKGNIKYYAMLCVNNKVKPFSQVSTGREFPLFDWSKEQSTSIYIGITANEDLREDYAKFGIDIESLKMKLGLGIEEQDFWSTNKKQKGPTYLGSVHHVYDLEFDNVFRGASYKYDNIQVKSIKLASKVSKHVDLVNFSKLHLEWIMKVPDLNLTTAIRPNKAKKGLIRKVYVIKFDLDYTSPTGKKVKGLRPFGPIFDKNEDKIYPSELQILSLTQEGVPPKSTIPPLGIKLPESDSYLSDNLPWTTIQRDQSKSKSSASVYWNSIKDDEKAKKKWLLKWIKEGAELLTAPEQGKIS